MGVDFYLGTMSEDDLYEKVRHTPEVEHDDLYDQAILYSGSHAQRSYRGFMHWRRAIAARVGIDLDTMQGYGGQTPWPDDDGDGDGPTLVPLLHHSDSGGDLDPPACRRVADALRELPPLEDEHDHRFTTQLLAMLDEAARDGRWLLFR